MSSLQSVAHDADVGGDVEIKADPLDKDVIFEILKNRRRRDALRYLEQNGGTARLDELAEYIAAKENNITVMELSSDQRKRVYIGLYQCHLPKMDSAGIIAFNKNRGTIQLLESAGQLDPYLMETQTESPSSIGKYVLAMAITIGLGVSAALIGISPFTSIPGLWWAALSTATLVAVTGVQLYTEYSPEGRVFELVSALRGQAAQPTE
ncbi:MULTISPECIES: hypothetical protein [unclassified Haladaptatus]|uniref:DUF7344 domain-containing protein n=1 Tax=unclassified Haladaptatus TaxID=2622732 RepID=UPI0023E78318|nr:MULTISPECIES: hypothetical protein [unclassified Haladaptatus]